MCRSWKNHLRSCTPDNQVLIIIISSKPKSSKVIDGMSTHSTCNDMVVPGMTRRHCGKCEGCSLLNCGTCAFCKDQPKFGGPEKKKKCCELQTCRLVAETLPRHMLMKKSQLATTVSMIFSKLVNKNSIQ